MSKPNPTIKNRFQTFGWVGWFVLMAVFAAYLSSVMFVSEDKTILIPGKTTDGHYQIEMQCTACHKDDFSDLANTRVINEACLKCHQEDLDAAADSHPVKKFKDPRNAARLENIDAMQCIVCHTEHHAAVTNKMGVTQPEDYCAHCHQTIGEERPSHAGMGFDTCATAGCHNYHDNLTLYESLLARHAQDPDMLDEQLIPPSSFPAAYRESAEQPITALTRGDMDAPASVEVDEKLINDWLETAHANAGVSCMDCHQSSPEDGNQPIWIEKPTYTSCQQCHDHEVKGFLKGKHGMRLAAGLSPMTPGMARRPMKTEAAHQELSCVSCHNSHRFDRQVAAVDSCISCHDDSHSQNYFESPHYGLWLKELSGESPAGSGVSCASCHMPRTDIGTKSNPQIRVEHNQNSNLTPNEKMIKTTCMNCHGLGFAIDNMADPTVIQTNFSERTEIHNPSVDMAWERELEKRKAEEKENQ